MNSEYILLKTNVTFDKVYEHLKLTLLELDDKALGQSGHSRFGLNIGGGQYYSFSDTERLTINLIRNVGEVEIWERDWAVYVWIENQHLDDDSYRVIRNRIIDGLNKLGNTEIRPNTN